MALNKVIHKVYKLNKVYKLHMVIHKVNCLDIIFKVCLISFCWNCTSHHGTYYTTQWLKYVRETLNLEVYPETKL